MKYLVILAILSLNSCKEYFPGRQCVLQTKILEIISVNYRSTTIKLENEHVIEAYSGDLKLGEYYCERYNDTR
ncbi:MAG: hypothetical protein ACXW2E_00660 [Nitrososphaeraceae archaeon]